MNEAIKKNGIKFGVISGIISIVVTSLMYAVDINLFINSWIQFGLVIFYLTLGIFVVSSTKKELGGTINFKEAFTSYFIYSVIGIVIANIFNYVLFNFIDTAAKDQILEITFNKTVEMMQKFGTPKEALKETIIALKENDPYTIVNIIKGSAFSIIFSSIIGMIIAAIMKSKTNPLNE